MDLLARIGANSVGVAELAWQIRGAGDHDGDSDGDILWRNTSSGAVLIWEIENLARIGSNNVGGAGLAWEIR